MDSNHQVSLLDIGLVVEKLIGSGYVSEYSKKEFKTRYVKYLFKMVISFKKLKKLINLQILKHFFLY